MVPFTGSQRVLNAATLTNEHTTRICARHVSWRMLRGHVAQRGRKCANVHDLHGMVVFRKINLVSFLCDQIVKRDLTKCTAVEL
jgi:hypothetical protein